MKNRKCFIGYILLAICLLFTQFATITKASAATDTHADDNAPAAIIEDGDIVQPLATAGSAQCLVDIAKTQTDVTSGEDYYDWFGETAAGWCAIFILWCADQSNIQTGIIPRESNPTEMQSEFKDRGRYYERPSISNVTPKVGDIYFYGPYSYSSASHVGIVTSVNTTTETVGIIDGNNNGRVTQYTVDFDASTFLGFGRPAYASSGHSYSLTYDANYHWRACTSCAIQSGSATAHTMVQYGSGSRCSVCYYTTNISVNRLTEDAMIEPEKSGILALHHSEPRRQN